jgi:hypothetical protein
MYRRVGRAFREAYSDLWQAMVQGDRALGERACAALGSPEPAATFEAMSLMLTYRPAASTSAQLGTGISKEERLRLREKYKDVTPEQIQAFMRGLPRDLMFVLRSTDLLRGMNRELGGSSRDRFVVFAESAIEGAVLSNLARADARLRVWRASADALEAEARARKDASTLHNPLPLWQGLRASLDSPFGWQGLIDDITLSRTPEGAAALRATEQARLGATAAIARRFGLPTPRVPLADTDAEVNLPVDAELDALPAHPPLPADPLHQASLALPESALPLVPASWIADALHTVAAWWAVFDLRTRLLLARGIASSLPPAPLEGSQIDHHHHHRRRRSSSSHDDEDNDEEQLHQDSRAS